MRPHTRTSRRVLAALALAAVFASAGGAVAQWNRPPNAPTLLSPAANARLTATGLTTEIPLQWRNNGDPDRDAVTFYLDTMYWDVYTRSWKPGVKGYIAGTSAKLPAKGSPGASVYLAWRIFACDAAQRSNPWFQASGWRVFQVAFPKQQEPRPQPPVVNGFDFGNRWEVWGYHTGGGTWVRSPNGPNTFRATWKDKNGNVVLSTTVTMTVKDGHVHATSMRRDGKLHTVFYFVLHEKPAIAKGMRAVPRNKKLGGGHHQGHGNGWTAGATVTS